MNDEIQEEVREPSARQLELHRPPSHGLDLDHDRKLQVLVMKLSPAFLFFQGFYANRLILLHLGMILMIEGREACNSASKRAKGPAQPARHDLLDESSAHHDRHTVLFVVVVPWIVFPGDL